MERTSKNIQKYCNNKHNAFEACKCKICENKCHVARSCDECRQDSDFSKHKANASSMCHNNHNCHKQEQKKRDYLYDHCQDCQGCHVLHSWCRYRYSCQCDLKHPYNDQVADVQSLTSMLVKCWLKQNKDIFFDS